MWHRGFQAQGSAMSPSTVQPPPSCPYQDLSLAVPFTMVQDHIWFHLVRLLSPGAHWSPVQIYILISSQTRENVEHPFKGVPCCQLKDAFESKKNKTSKKKNTQKTSVKGGKREVRESRRFFFCLAEVRASCSKEEKFSKLPAIPHCHQPAQPSVS